MSRTVDRRMLLGGTAAAAIAAAGTALGQGRAAELLMFEEAGCPWCARWNAEVGPGYPKSAEGKIAPLRRLDIRGGAPQGVKLKAPVRVTPTFVLINNGAEVGRITGYPGADFFWGLLEGLIQKMGPAPDAPAQRAI